MINYRVTYKHITVNVTSHSSDRQDEFKPWVLEGVEVCDFRNIPAVQANVLSVIEDLHGHEFTDGEIMVNQAFNTRRVNQKSNWCQIATNAASELRKDGYLFDVVSKGGRWIATGKGGTRRSPGGPLAVITGTGRCLECFEIHSDGSSCFQ